MSLVNDPKSVVATNFAFSQENDTPLELVNPTRHYLVLDLMRGLAALAVLIFHINYMLGSSFPLLHKGYLAVDFFFVLSGFVICANYNFSVKPLLSFKYFLTARIARLWPLFFIATLFGALMVITKLTRDTGYFDGERVFGALLLNSVMLPSFLYTYNIDRLFLLNGASWSVFFELVINIVFFAALRKLSLRPLLLLCVGFGCILIYVAQTNGGLDGGWSAANFHVGAARVFFGFIAGMVIYHVSLRVRGYVFGWVGSLGVAAGLCLLFVSGGNWLIDCLFVIIGFPLLLLLASKCEIEGVFARLGGRLGDISYSVYLFQTPAMLFVSGVCEFIVGKKIAEFAPFSGLFFILGMLGFSYLSWRYFELPARNYLRVKLSSSNKK